MNWYKIAQTNKNKILYVMRGISGSGKSTKAKSLPGITTQNIFSTDDLIADNSENYKKFFKQMEENDDWTPLALKHEELLNMLRKAIMQGKSPLALDNTNLNAWNCKEHVQTAIKNGYQVIFVDVGTGGLSPKELAERNNHGVNEEIIQKMIDKYESEGPLTINKVLMSEKPEETEETE